MPASNKKFPMNPRIILHLLRTDWQRLRKPVIVLWVLFVAAALPFILADSDDQKMIQWMNYSWSGEFEQPPGEFMPQDWIRYSVYVSEVIATCLGLIIAATLGSQSVKQPVTPVRSRERTAAIALGLFVFLVFPLCLLVFINLMVHGMDPLTSLMASASTGLSVWMLLGLVAAFAAWLPSPWLLLAGCAALVTTVGFISEFYKPLDYLFRGHLVLPLLPSGRREWLLGVLSIALLLLFLPLLGHRLAKPWRIVVAVVLIVIAGIPPVLLPSREVRVTTDPRIESARIRPELRNIRIAMENSSAVAKSTPLQLSASIKSIACPPGHAVRWEPTSGRITRNGRLVAALIAPKDPFKLASNDQGVFDPGDSGETDAELAARAALPGQSDSSQPIRFVRQPESNFTRLTQLGRLEIPDQFALDSSHDAELEMEFTGTVYRYETIWDLPLENSPAGIRADQMNWRVKRLSSKTGGPWADVMVTYPETCGSADRNTYRWFGNMRSLYRPYFYLPSSRQFFEASKRLMQASGPLFSGAGWSRWVLAPESQWREGLDFTGLRLILLKPVPVARFNTTISTRFHPWMSDDSSDYALMHRYSVDGPVYRREWFGERPDPRTCDTREFGKWLRIPASVFDTRSSSQRDLACFAPRFGGLMAKVADRRPVAEGMLLGLPEESRDSVIGLIESHERPGLLASVAWRRGWLDEARAGIQRRFEDGGLWITNEVMALEEPSTYPELISRFLENPERETYEKLRLLPGMDPLLGDAIAKAVNAGMERTLRERITILGYRAPYGPFLYAAKRGDPKALDTVIDLYKASGDKSEYAPWRDLQYVIALPELPGKGAKKLSAWLGDKTASSFRFDPLLRMWKPLP